jgi:hypothetical protein
MSGSRPPLSEEQLRQQGAYRAAAEVIGAGSRDMLGLPERSLGEDMRRRAYDMEEDDDRRYMKFPPHLRKLFDHIGPDDVNKLIKLMSLKESTVKWIDGKSDKEYEKLDGAVEFLNSSRTAGKVLFYVAGVLASFLLSVFALAKSGWDVFTTFRGVK